MVWARAQIVEVGADFSDMKIQFENTLSDVWTTRFSEDIARDGKHSGSTSSRPVALRPAAVGLLRRRQLADEP